MIYINAQCVLCTVCLLGLVVLTEVYCRKAL